MSDISVDLNFDGVEPAVPFEPLEDGAYTLVIESAELKPSKKADTNPSMMLIFHTEDNPDKKIWHNIYLGNSEMNKKFILQFLIALLGGELSNANVTFNAEFAAGIVGMPVRAVVEKVKRDDNPNKYTNKITSFEVMAF